MELYNNSYNETEVVSEKDVEYGRFLTFHLDNGLYGIDIAEVMQIIGVQKIIPMPEYPPYAKGIINLRGDIIPVIDMRLRLKKSEKEYDERTCIIVLIKGSKHYGLIVDAVAEVRSVKMGEMEVAPELEDDTNKYVSGIALSGKDVILMLDLDKIVGQEH